MAAEPAGSDKGGSWRICLLSACCFLLGSAQYAFLGIISQVADSAGVSVAAAGQLVTAFALANALLTPFAIMLTTRLGQRRQLMAALCIMIVGMSMTAAFWSYPVLMAARCVMGVGNGLFVATSFVAAAGLARKGHEAQALANVSVGFSAAFVLAIPLGRVIAQVVDWHLIYAGLAALALVALFVIARAMPHSKGARAMTFRQQLVPLHDSRIILALSMTFLTFVSYSAFNTYLTPYLEILAPNDAAFVSAVLFAIGIVAIVGTKSGGFLGDHIGIKLTLLGGMAFQILSLVFLPACSGIIWLAVALLCIWMMSRWSFIPAQNLNLISLSRKGGGSSVVMGLSNSFLQLGNAVGSGLGGIVVSTCTVPTLVWVAVAVELLGFLAGIMLFGGQRRKRNVRA